mmetsp:Transcript_8561/g.20377  ORF Transcript_8561/g.20377 Transcript_8561/m.20377 type:complete len:207 (-) Transcript_8561:17-637(-)
MAANRLAPHGVFSSGSGRASSSWLSQEHAEPAPNSVVASSKASKALLWSPRSALAKAKFSSSTTPSAPNKLPVHSRMRFASAKASSPASRSPRIRRMMPKLRSNIAPSALSMLRLTRRMRSASCSASAAPVASPALHRIAPIDSRSWMPVAVSRVPICSCALLVSSYDCRSSVQRRPGPVPGLLSSALRSPFKASCKPSCSKLSAF